MPTGVNINTTEERIKVFWAKVIIGAEDDCWPFTGYTTNSGHGQVWLGRYRKIGAHVFAYQTTFGGVPIGLQVNHRCGNPACCNPKHLYAGTQGENIRDHFDFGNKPTSRFYVGEVWLMRRLRQAGFSYHKIAAMFKCSYGAAYAHTHQTFCRYREA